MVSAVDKLFASPEVRNRLVRAAWERVKSRYDWSVVGENLFSIYVDLLSKSR
jgi:glycosyltransferase involved in cell wall biosynthesis